MAADGARADERLGGGDSRARRSRAAAAVAFAWSADERATAAASGASSARGCSRERAAPPKKWFEGTFADERFDASAHITLARDEGSGGIVATVSPPLPGFPAAGIEDEATDSILLLGLRGTHFGDGKGILWSNNVLWTRVGAPSCGPGCVLT